MRTSGHVDGRLRKPVATGSPTLDFEIGSGSDYAPVEVAFSSVSGTGDLTASTTATEHPDIESSGFETSKNVNRYHTLTASGVVFVDADLTFHFGSTDVDTFADPDSFEVRKFDSPDWTSTIPGIRSATSTQALDVTNFSDFAIGELRQYTITANANGQGTIDPSGVQVVRHGEDLTFAMTPDPGFHVADVVVDSTSQGASLEFSLTNVTADHTVNAYFAETHVSVEHQSQAEGNVGTTAFHFSLSRNSTVTPHAVSVSYSTEDSTAVSPTDYQAVVDSTITFDPNSTSAVATVTVNGDLTNEADEVFFVNLSSPIHASISNGKAYGTIQNDDPIPQEPSISIGDVTVTEADSGTVDAVFTVTLSEESGQTVTVDYATNDDTATAPDDYTSTGGTLTFLPGDTEETITVLVRGDLLDEEDQETFFVDLTNPQNATFLGGDNQATGTIEDDDPLPVISIDFVTDVEGDSSTTSFDFTVSLSDTSGRTVTADYATRDGTALEPGDYASDNGTLVFDPGEVDKTISVSVVGDLLNEDDETFFVDLSSPQNTTFADSVGVGTIQNQDPEPSVAISDTSVTEGNVNAIFSVTLSAASGKTVTTDYFTTNGTAQSPGDYSATSGTVTFGPGDVSEPLSIPIHEDPVDEEDETFFVNLLNPSGATVSDDQGQGTIVDDDPPPTIKINDVTRGENASGLGTTDFEFTVTLGDSGITSGRVITVDYATSDGTGIAGSDYDPESGTLTFQPGDSTMSVTATVNDDALDENDEFFFVTLSNATNASIADGIGTALILDDDDLPLISIDDVTDLEGDSGTKDFTFTVTLVPQSGRTVIVAYDTANSDDITAMAPEDYTSASGLLTFDPGETTKPVVVAVNGDDLNEADETFFVNLSSPTNATFGDNRGVGAVQNDDPVTATLSLNDITAQEGNAGSSSFTFTVSLSEPSGQDVVVDYGTADGTATVADNDYESTSGTATIPSGQPSTSIQVVVNGDLVDEDDQTFFVNLSNAMHATISDTVGVGTIANDDDIPLDPTISISDYSSFEGDGGDDTFLFTVVLSDSSQQTITVDFETADGTAQAPVDYDSNSGTLTFVPGDMVETVSVTVHGDVLDEADETFFVNLSNPQNSSITDGQGRGTIQDDDDVAPAISIDDVAVSEGNSGTVNATFIVTLSGESGQTVSVSYATQDGTATTANNDYQNAAGTIVFPEGSVSSTVTILVDGDVLNEEDETFVVHLHGPANATIADSTGIATILNDDDPPGIEIDDLNQNEGDSGTTAFGFIVSLSEVSGKTVSVNFTTADSTASAPGDYVATSGTLTFDPGEGSKPIIVQIQGDEVNEPDEVFNVFLSLAQNAVIVDKSGTGTIVDDDAGNVSISIDDVTKSEGNSGTTDFTFEVALSAPSFEIVTVQFATEDGSAVADEDYTSDSDTLVFAIGEITREISIAVNADVVNELDESFFVNLSNSTNATITDGQAEGTILNDDDTEAPIVQVVYPNGGEQLAIGTTATLRWIATDDVGVTRVDLFLSRNGVGGSYEEVALDVSNTGEYAWTVEGAASDSAVFQVVVRDTAQNETTDLSDAVFMIDELVDAEEQPVTEFALSQVTPNPSRGLASIRFALPRIASVTVRIVDVRGREVILLREGLHDPGRYQIVWSGLHKNGGRVGAGVYYVLFDVAGHRRFTRNLIWIH